MKLQKIRNEKKQAPSITTWNEFDRAEHKGVMMTFILAHTRNACLNKFSQHEVSSAGSLILHKFHIKPFGLGISPLISRGLLAAFYFRLFITIGERCCVYVFGLSLVLRGDSFIISLLMCLFWK